MPSLNPQSGPDYGFSVYLSDSCAGLRVRVYSKGMTALVDTELSGSFQPGWNAFKVNLGDLNNGLYYVLICSQSERSFETAPVRLMVIR
jgi:hypothetical protein